MEEKSLTQEQVEEALRNYGCPSKENDIISLGIYSKEFELLKGGEFNDIIRTYPKQEAYNWAVAHKLRFYLENNIPIKFRLIEPKNFYESKGKILEVRNYVILEYNNLKFIHPLWEIDIHTIYPLDYNPIIEFIRREIPQEVRDRIFKRDNYLCQLKLEGCSIHADTIDHIIAINNGGGDNIENLQASCLHCNCKKGSKVLY